MNDDATGVWVSPLTARPGVELDLGVLQLQGGQLLLLLGRPLLALLHLGVQLLLCGRLGHQPALQLLWTGDTQQAHRAAEDQC